MSQPSNEGTQERGRTQVMVGMAGLKDLARSMLPYSSALNRLILSEPDLLPADEIHTRTATYSKLLYLELKES